MKIKRILAFLLTMIIMTGCSGCSASAKGLVTTNQKRINEMILKGNSYWTEQTSHEGSEPVTVTEYNRSLSYILQYPKTGYPQTDARIEAIVTEIRNAFDQEYIVPPAPKGETGRDEKKEATLYLGYETYLTDENHLSLLFFETHETSDGMSPHTRIQAFHFDLTEDKEVAAEELMWNRFRENASRYTEEYFTSD